jgi:PAS domain S-box-containing protein
LSRTSGRSASRLAAILDALPDALLLVDATGVVVNANAVALDLFEGESAERLLGKPVAVLLPGLGRAVATAGPGPAALPAGSGGAGEAAARAPQRGPAERLAARRTDGTLFPAEVNTAKLPDEGDELVLYVVRDLSGTLDVEAELRRQQRQIELILRAASEGIIGVDSEARIVLVNPAGARILRHRASDLGGQDVHELIAHSAADGTPISADKVLLVDSLRTGTRHRSLDEVLWRSDGTAVTVDMTTAPVYEGDVIIGAVMTFEDNSETRAAQRRARELAEVLDRDLRAPLAAVLTELRDVSDFGIGELGPNVRQVLGAATSDLGEVARLVDDIVDYQHMVIGDTAVEPRKIALSSVVDAAVEATEADAAALGVDLISHTADVEVSVDPQLFATMLAHLLADMVNAAPVGGKVVVTAARRGPVARIEIRGPHTGGGPLHLPIARAIVAQHRGTVTTHRIAGKGNTHVVEVPLEGSADGGSGGGGAMAIAGGARAVRVAQILPASRVRAPSSETAEAAAAPSQVKQVEKTNGHHTSHGADVRRPVVSAAAPEQSTQARIPAQVRSSLSRSAGMNPMDLKPSKPLPTSDVWSRPQRNGAQPGTQDAEADADIDADVDPDVDAEIRSDTDVDMATSSTSTSSPTSAARGVAGAEVTEPREQQPWQPQADAETQTQTQGPARAEAESRARRVVEEDVELDRPQASSTTPGVVSGTVVPPNGGVMGTAAPNRYGLQPVRRDVEKLTPPRMTPVPAKPEEAQPRGRRRAVAADAPSENAERATTTQASTANADQLHGTSSNNALRDSGGGSWLSSGDVVGALGTVGGGVTDDMPTQAMPPMVPQAAEVAEAAPALRPASAPSPAAPASAAAPVRAPAESGVVGASAGSVEATGGRALLLWPEPDSSTVGLLDERGYEAVSLDNFDALPRTLTERTSQGSAKPCAVLVDPIAAPITRRGLRILRGAAINAGLPIVVTAGIGGASAEAAPGPDPALLLQALTPPAVSLPRVLLIEAREDLATAMADALERQGMQVLLAATDTESISRASDGVPDVVLMDLMQVRRRRTGIVEWLRDHERLTTTPIVVYTALGTDSAEFATGLRSGNASLYLAERVTEGEVANRIGDLLAKVC